ncbi:NAD-dependent epimerase/dehydratase family protein [bacterium]|nr:NAD-dependent epimerase/dehydratase family protein [bacterium]
MKTALVLGGGGFIGHNLIKRLKNEGFYVLSVDLKVNEFEESFADEFIIDDLRNQAIWSRLVEFKPDWIFQLAADMGGAGYVFTGEHDADIMHNSSIINLNMLQHFKNENARIFFASSACIYPEHNQIDPNNPICSEDSAYPANPDSEYGWEKLFSERMMLAFAKDYNMDIRIARLHNVFGPYGSYKGGKEKAPAALCRKVINAQNNTEIEIWGHGKQTRSFLFIDDALDAIILLMKSNYLQPINIGSEEMISINNLAENIISLSGKSLTIKNIDGPVGVQGRSSDNRQIEVNLNWKPKLSLKEGITHLYHWISQQEINS